MKFLRELIKEALEESGFAVKNEFSLEHPDEFSHGDYATNAALIAARDHKKNPREIASLIADKIRGKKHPSISKVEVAGPGFINFFLTPEFFVGEIEKILADKKYGANDDLKGKKVMVEYTDMNPFKEFHIGHLMSNSIGESLSRIYEYSGADVVRATYGGDVGLHVAKTIWGLEHKKNEFPGEDEPLSKKASFLGKCYTFGANAYEDDEKAKEEIQALNKLIFESLASGARKNAGEVMKLYDWGRKISLEHFETVYKKIDTKFDYYFFESEVADEGVKIVGEFLGRGVFEKSDGAVVYKGEQHGLHTRVFINALGIPTYEAKELGLNKLKFKLLPLDQSLIIAASEQIDYFRVLMRVMGETIPEIAERTKHISHGMLRFSSGKMSSRKGNVITGEKFIEEVKGEVAALMKERGIAEYEKDLAVSVAVAAIRYSMLKQSPGRDIVFDMETSVSFEGDSGPYLQYSYARTCSLQKRAENEGVAPLTERTENPGELERLLYRFPEIVSRSRIEYSPNLLATYLVRLARTFNSWYGAVTIVNKNDELSHYRLAVAIATGQVLKNGLHLLGIRAPEKM